MPSKKESISIVIPTYNDNARLVVCLDSIIHLHNNGATTEIIVVNNSSEKIPAEVRTRYPTVNFLTESRVGSYAARNTGVLNASGSIIGFTDSDCIVSEQWISSASKAFSSDPNLARLAGPIHIKRSTSKEEDLSEIYDSLFAFPQLKYVEMGFAATANLFVRRKAFEVVGYFDESLLSGGDAEWGIRATHLGLPIKYCQSSAVFHPPRTYSQHLQKCRRVAGGTYSLNRKSSTKGKVLSIVSELKPPARRWLTILASKELRFTLKLKLFIYTYTLQLTQFHEKVLLAMGKKCERV